MFITLSKFFIIWCLLCEVIGPTMSAPQTDLLNGDANIRIKRYPAEGFSLFGFSPFSVPNPISNAKQAVSSFGNIFAPAGTFSQNENVFKNNKSVMPQEDVNKRYNPTYRPSDIILPSIEDSYISGMPYKKNAHQESGNSDLEKSQFSDTEYRSFDISKSNTNTEGEDLGKDIDTKLINDIFSSDNSLDGISTVADTTVDSTTETGDYESTTTEGLLRIPGPVVASLLG